MAGRPCVFLKTRTLRQVFLMPSAEAFDACDFSGATDLGDESPVTVTVPNGPAYYACQVTESYLVT